MTAVVETPSSQPVSTDLRHVAVVSAKSAIAYTAVTAAMALLLLLVPRDGDVRFRMGAEGDAVRLPDVALPGMATAWVCVAIAAIVSAVAWALLRVQRKPSVWFAVVLGTALLVAFLSWSGAGSQQDLPVTRLVGGAVLLSVPILFGALGGVIGERAGVVNIAIESQLLLGAFAAAITGSLTDSPVAGLIAAIVAGMVVAVVLGVFAITYKVDQVIVGVVLNVLVIGLTSFFYSEVLVPNAERLNDTERFRPIAIPVLSDVPILGPALFRQSLLVYLAYIAVPLVWFALYRTRWGLRLRAVGEHPKAADTVGIKVELTRYRALLIAGAVVGLGGAFYTVVSVSSFGKEMTAGAGFIALAAVIFGKWDPVRAALAALLFGFAANLKDMLSLVGAPVPSQFMLMLPYVVTLFAVAGLVGKSRAPAADGEAYVKE